MTNESGRHYCSRLDDLQWISEVFPLSFRKFLQLKKERKWWRGRFTVQWQQRKKKFCPELDKRFPLVGIRWGENVMQTLLQQDYREWLLICVCNWFYKLQNWINSKPREIKWRGIDASSAFIFASTSSDQFYHVSSEHFRNYKYGEQRALLICPASWNLFLLKRCFQNRTTGAKLRNIRALSQFNHFQ